MVDDTQTELNVGLSEEERDDLENLIRSMRKEPSVPSIDEIPPDVRQRIILLTEHVARLSEMVLKFDGRMKSFYEIIRLFYQKSSKMNERIDTVVRYLKAMNKL
jgi:hypothetical protein